MRKITATTVLLAASILMGSELPGKSAPASQPATAASSAESTSAEQAKQSAQQAGGRTNPFGPSSTMRERAKISAANGNSTETRIDPVQSGSILLPVLEGVIVKDKTVIACFRIGASSVVVEQGGVIGNGESALVFVSFENDTAYLRNAKGEKIANRLASRPATNTPAPAPAKNLD